MEAYLGLVPMERSSGEIGLEFGPEELEFGPEELEFGIAPIGCTLRREWDVAPFDASGVLRERTGALASRGVGRLQRRRWLASATTHLPSPGP